MSENLKYELQLIKNELQKIINEVNDVSSGVNNDFVNIGNDVCADSIEAVAELYTTALRKLNFINTSNATETLTVSNTIAY